MIQPTEQCARRANAARRCLGLALALALVWGGCVAGSTSDAGGLADVSAQPDSGVGGDVASALDLDVGPDLTADLLDAAEVFEVTDAADGPDADITAGG